MTDDRGNVGVIFDLDGTLADTLEDITASLNHALRQVGAGEHEPQAVAMMIGDGADVLVQRALGTTDPQPVAGVLRHFADHYRAHALDRTRLYEGIAAQLDQLVAWGWKLAVLSNKPHPFTVQCCRALLGRWPLASIRGADTRTPKKPDPTAALEIARQMEVEPSHVFFVGDSPNDIRAGRSAGMVSVAVAWGFSDRQRLLTAVPDVICLRPADLAASLHARRSDRAARADLSSQ